MRRNVAAWGRLLASALTLTVVVWRLGTGPFLAGLHAIDAWSLAAAAGLAMATTVGYAWRWKLVAGGLGVGLSLSTAVTAYYRSMFLNAALPGGIVGDLHRGVSHGRSVHDFGRALRSVAWERFAGQFVQFLLTVIVLLVLPSPVRPFMPLVAIAVVAVVFAVMVLARARIEAPRSVWARLLSGAAGDIRNALFARRAWLGIGLTSVLGVAGHIATFLIAARTAGVSAPMSQLLPIAFLVMTAMVLPSAGSWGPREGMTAWAYAAAGLGAQHGVATAVAYGVMVLAASLPGAFVLVLAWFRSHRPPEPNQVPFREQAAHV